MLLPTRKERERESKPCCEMRPVMPQGGKCMVACTVVSVYARWGICFTLHLLCTISFVQICARVLVFVGSWSFTLQISSKEAAKETGMPRKWYWWCWLADARAVSPHGCRCWPGWDGNVQGAVALDPWLHLLADGSGTTSSSNWLCPPQFASPPSQFAVILVEIWQQQKRQGVCESISCVYLRLSPHQGTPVAVLSVQAPPAPPHFFCGLAYYHLQHMEQGRLQRAWI